MKNEIRIIAGQWRSRKLRFPAAEGLRPTPDRVRETLFNWLRHDVEHARCLDLYAGSGALGFEAASRSAGRVVLVESDPKIFAALEQNRKLLDAAQVEALRADVARFLAGPAERFDVVFLDPPFHKDLVAPAAEALESRGWLAPRAKVYIETEREWQPTDLPSHWRLLKNGTAGEVAYRLYERNPSTRP
jgi:16S rRNA (guanine966-N2)-methyltransferase